MSLQELLEWYAEQERLKQMKQKDLFPPGPKSTYRGKDGNLLEQGVNGVFTDALPYGSMQKRFPYLFDVLDQAPENIRKSDQRPLFDAQKEYERLRKQNPAKFMI